MRLIAVGHEVGTAIQALAERANSQVITVDDVDGALSAAESEMSLIVSTVNHLSRSGADFARISSTAAVGVVPARDASHAVELLERLDTEVELTRWHYVSLLEWPPARVRRDVQAWSRSTLRIPDLRSSLAEGKSGLILAAHGHEDRVYLGTEAVYGTRPQLSPQGTLDVGNFPARIVVLNTCFGAQATCGWTPMNRRVGVNWLWTGAQAVIGTTGVKDMSSVECALLLDLLGDGWPLGEAVREINHFLMRSGTDGSVYVLMGIPGARVRVGATAAPSTDKVAPQAAPVYRARLSSGEERAFSWGGVPRGYPRVDGTDRAALLADLRSYERALRDDLPALRHMALLPPGAKGLGDEVGTAAIGAARALAAESVSDVPTETSERIRALGSTLGRIQDSVLEHLRSRAMRGPFPFNESYRPGFVLETVSYARCPLCGADARTQGLRHAAATWVVREQCFCVRCGLVRDRPPDLRGELSRSGRGLVLHVAPSAIGNVAATALEGLTQSGHASTRFKDELALAPVAAGDRRLLCFVMVGLRVAHFAVPPALLDFHAEGAAAAS